MLYDCGSYAMGRVAAWGSGSSIEKAALYLLMLPGVVVHETAHYLSCVLTGTRVGRFAPFSPKSSDDGQLGLSYVRHEHRSVTVTAFIGLAPVVLNPVEVLAVIALLTPLTWMEVVGPRPEVFEERLLWSGYLTESLGMALIWAYLASASRSVVCQAERISPPCRCCSSCSL